MHSVLEVGSGQLPFPLHIKRALISSAIPLYRSDIKALFISFIFLFLYYSFYDHLRSYFYLPHSDFFLLIKACGQLISILNSAAIFHGLLYWCCSSGPNCAKKSINTWLLNTFGILSLLFVLHIFLLKILPLHLIKGKFVIFCLVLQKIHFIVHSPPCPPWIFSWKMV